MSRAGRLGGPRRLLGLALLLAVSCRGAAQTGAGGDSGQPAAAPPPPPPPVAEATVDAVRIFLIAPGDAGRHGDEVACHDSAVPVTRPLPQPAPALAAALGALLALRDAVEPASGLTNPLYSSRLQLAALDRQGGDLRVRLTGYVERGDPCDGQRLLATLTATARQFAGIATVHFEVEGHPLPDLLAGPGTPTPAP